MAMELKDLTEDEQLAFVALLERVVEADTSVSEPEAKKVRAAVAALGKKAYEAAAEEVDKRFTDEAKLRQFLPKVTRQEARDLIYETLLETALADVARREEMELLDWLVGIWNIKTRILDPSS